MTHIYIGVCATIVMLVMAAVTYDAFVLNQIQYNTLQLSFSSDREEGVFTLPP